jgi:hypothetical protein
MEVVLERPGRVAGVPSGLRLSVSLYKRKFPRMREGDQRKPSVHLLIPLSSSSKTNTLPLWMSLRSRSASLRVTRGMSRLRAASRIKRASSVVSRNPTHGGSVHCC